MSGKLKIAVIDCKACGACDDVCPLDAIKKIGKITQIDYEKCDGCLKCVEVCCNKAIIRME